MQMHWNTKIVLLLSALHLIGSGCDARVPFERLVDPAQREGAVSEPASLLVRAPAAAANREGGASILPTATIRDDTRYVLATHAYHLIADRKPVSATESETAVFQEEMAELFPEGENLLIDVRSFVFGQQEWKPRPPILRTRDELGEDLLLELEVEVAGAEPRETVLLFVEAYQAPPLGGTRYTTPARYVPDGARLEFAFGIMKAALLQGPVRFMISACEADVCESLFSEVLDPTDEDRAVWQDRSISLAKVWGETRTLLFEAIPERPDAMSLPLWADPRVVVEPSTSRTNVIVLSIDTLRRDHLSLYGYERDTSPYLKDHLGPQGFVFENLISEAATTETSHMSLFTSLPALVHGSTDYGAKLAVPVSTLADEFRSQGYDTGAMTEGGPLSHKLGMNIGFDRWVENQSVHFLFPVGQVDRVFAQAWDWIVQRRGRPFFLFLHTFQVHHPLSPPIPYRKLFLEEGVDSASLSEEELAVVSYDQEIRYVDDQLGELWTKLENRGIAQNTVLVLVSDHGDEFWEHGERGHSSLPYEEVLNVPLFMMGPPIAKGQRSTRPLHHIDVMPTILDLVGVPVPDHVIGESFADLARTGDPGDPTVEPVPEDAPSRVRVSAAWHLPKGISSPVFAVRDEHYKVIRYQEEGEPRLDCFDLASDPAEQTNLCTEGTTDDATRLLSDLEAYEAAMIERRIALAGENPEALDAGTVPLSPEHEAQLRALGYVE